MPEFHLADSIITSLNAQEPWPDNVKLFQPYEVEQMLLPDNASCLAVQAFLKMCNLPFEVEMRWNAEFMSPSGRVPFVQCGAFVVSELEPIVQFAANKGVTLCGDLSTEEKAEMRAYMSLITNVLLNAELYISWIDSETYKAVTRVRNASVYPWPLGWLQTRAKRNATTKRLKALNWHDKSLDQVLADVEQCCNSLSQRLGERDYFFGNSPTAVDALVFGHVRALLSAAGPKAALMIKPITTSLLKHLQRMLRATGMTLTPQEEYLMRQAGRVTRRRGSPERARRSNLSLRGSRSRDHVHLTRDVYGFKPFASKQIKIMSSKEGGLTCTYDASRSSVCPEVASERRFALELIEDLLDKVEEVSLCALHAPAPAAPPDELGFELVFASEGDTKYASNNDFLDTIEEHASESSAGGRPPLHSDSLHFAAARDFEEKGFDNYKYREVLLPQSAHNFEDKLCDGAGAAAAGSAHSFKEEYLNNSSFRTARAFRERAEFTPSTRKLDGNDSADRKYGDGELATGDNDSADTDMFHIVHDEEEDSDGMVTDKHLASPALALDSDSSKNKERKGDDSLTSNGSRMSTARTAVSSRSGSKSTLKVPSDEEISVESLLRHLRERNAAYGDTLQAADVD